MAPKIVHCAAGGEGGIRTLKRYSFQVTC
jgi:hypothetical protein